MARPRLEERGGSVRRASDVHGMLLGIFIGGASFLLSGFGLVGLLLYFLPTVVALRRKVPNSISVLVINLFLGWSLIGWVVALAMAVRTKPTY